MRRLLILTVLTFILFGCTTNDKQVSQNGTKQVGDLQTMNPFVNEAVQAGDFIFTLQTEENSKMYATITYVGDEGNKTIYHSASMFDFDVYEPNGERVYQSVKLNISDETILTKNIPYKAYFHGIKDIEVRGIFKVEATANFYVDPKEPVASRVVVPIMTLHEI